MKTIAYVIVAGLIMWGLFLIMTPSVSAQYEPCVWPKRCGFKIIDPCPKGEVCLD